MAYNGRVIKTFRYRIYPTKRHEQILSNQLAICCELYNAALQERREAWRREQKSISWFDQVLQITQIKQIREDVAAMRSNVLHGTLRRVDLAFKSFYTRARTGGHPGYPRFRAVRRYNSMTFRQVGRAVLGNKLRLSKVGNIRIKLHRPLEGTIKTLTVKREAGKWFAVFMVECEASSLSFNANAVGIDVGLNRFATLSDGTAIANPRWFRSAQAKLRRLQRRVTRRRKGSNRRRKAGVLVARLHNHIRDQRRDFHHRESRKIVNTNGLIVVEDLNIKGLAGGMLSKSVNDAGWANFLFMLAYKAESAGRVFVKVDPRGTSQTCLCGAEVRKTLKDRVHSCLSCGLVADRDHVSAQIILAKALPSGANVADLIACVA